MSDAGFDTKKLSATGNREEEAEFGLQRAETGDRRLSQNNNAPSSGSNDLRAAHSSDFFSGQRDRGRDETPSVSPTPRPPAPRPSHSRQSFRRVSTPRPAPTTTQYTSPPPTSPPQPSTPQQYEITKRKLVRKRPIYVSTASPQPTTFSSSTPPQQTYQEPPQQNLISRRPQTKTSPTTPDVPPQYREFKDEYVEVARVTPKPKPNRYYPNNPTPLPASHATHAPQYNKKSGLIELYNIESQSTPGLNLQQNDNRPFKVKNSFNVAEVPREDFARTRSLNNRPAPTTTLDYNTPPRPTTTQSYKNYNSVSYDQDKNNLINYSKQNYFNNPTTAPTTTTTSYTTIRQDLSQNFNTVAYNTNNVFHSQSNFANPDEDDGQYHPPEGEDDGQYKPELYEGELLSGAHSLNIAASGNRLPEDQQKSYSKTKAPSKFVAQTAAPRPFRPAPQPTSTAKQTTRAPEYYTTTVLPQTQRTFDLFQTYTTTVRPSEFPGQDFVAINNAPLNRPTTTVTPRETRPPRPHAPTFPSNPVPKPTTKVPALSHPVNKKEDTSYDYAYYDSDPGFTEYDHIEEFGRTKKRA